MKAGSDFPFVAVIVPIAIILLLFLLWCLWPCITGAAAASTAMGAGFLSTKYDIFIILFFDIYTC